MYLWADCGLMGLSCGPLVAWVVMGGGRLSLPTQHCFIFLFFPLILDIVCIVNNFGAAIVSYRKYLFSLFIICDFPDDGLYYVFMLTTQ